MYKCKDIMTTTVVSVKPTDTIEQVADRMLRHHVSGFPVVDDDGHVVGVISEFDLLRVLYDPQTKNNRVEQYMTRNVVTINGDAHLTDAADFFLEHSMRRLPVVEDGKVIGIVGRRDLIRCIRDVRARVAKDIAAYKKPSRSKRTAKKTARAKKKLVAAK